MRTLNENTKKLKLNYLLSSPLEYKYPPRSVLFRSLVACLTFQNSSPWKWTWTSRIETASKAKFHRNGFFFSPSSALALACSSPAGILFIYFFIFLFFNLLNLPFVLYSSSENGFLSFSPSETEVSFSICVKFYGAWHVLCCLS